MKEKTGKHSYHLVQDSNFGKNDDAVPREACLSITIGQFERVEAVEIPKAQAVVQFFFRQMPKTRGIQIFSRT